MRFRTTVSPDEILSDNLARVLRATHRLLVLDYDGTLAPFHVDPMKAVPLPEIPALLEALSRDPDTTVAILSGRPVREVAALLGTVGIPVIGCHGFEHLDADGRLTVKPPSRIQREALAQGAELAVRAGLEGQLEVKTAAIALHTRALGRRKAMEVEAEFYRKWADIAPEALGCRSFNGGVELYCRGWNKGDAFNDLLRRSPEGTLPVYIGDDATDEDVFRILPESGIGIKVGDSGDATAAKTVLPDCEAVREFLRAWHSLATDTRGAINIRTVDRYGRANL